MPKTDAFSTCNSPAAAAIGLGSAVPVYVTTKMTIAKYHGVEEFTLYWPWSFEPPLLGVQVDLDFAGVIPKGTIVTGNEPGLNGAIYWYGLRPSLYIFGCVCGNKGKDILQEGAKYAFVLLESGALIPATEDDVAAFAKSYDCLIFYIFFIDSPPSSHTYEPHPSYQGGFYGNKNNGSENNDARKKIQG